MAFYYFVNVTRNIDDFIGKTDISGTGIISLFETTASANDWNPKDIIMAFPDKNSSPTIRYQNGELELKYKCDEKDEKNEENEKDESELKNCTYCNDILKDHTYGNICKKHIPSYALYEESYEESCEDSGNEYYEELSERKLVNELDDPSEELDDTSEELDDTSSERSDDEYRYYEDEGYGYQDEAEDCY